MALSTSVLPSDQTAPGTRWLAAMTSSKARTVQSQSLSVMTKAGTDKFFAELKAALEHAEGLLHSTTEDLGEARDKAREKLREASAKPKS